MDCYIYIREVCNTEKHTQHLHSVFRSRFRQMDSNTCRTRELSDSTSVVEVMVKNGTNHLEMIVIHAAPVLRGGMGRPPQLSSCASPDIFIRSCK